MKKTLNLFLLASFLFLDIAAFAQPGGPDEGSDPAPGAPINSNIIWLAITGLLFAIYTFRKSKKTA